MEKEFDKNIKNIYRPKLSMMADFKIKAKLRWVIFRLEMVDAVRGSMLLKKSLSLALIFISVFVGTSAYAYSSDSVIPGNYLYDYKRELEELDLKFTKNPASQAMKLSAFSERRIDEAKKLSQNFKADLAASSSGSLAGKLEAQRNTQYRNYILGALDDATAYKTMALNVASGTDSKILSGGIEKTWKGQQDKVIEIASNVGLDSGDRLVDKVLNILDDEQEESPEQQKFENEQDETDQTHLAVLPENGDSRVATNSGAEESDRIEDTAKAAQSVERLGRVKPSLKRNSENSLKENPEKNSRARTRLSLDQVKKNVVNFKQNVLATTSSNESEQDLVRHIEERVKKAEDKLKSQASSQSAERDLKSAENLMNFGKYFIRKDTENANQATGTPATRALREKAKAQFEQAKQKIEEKNEQTIQKLKQEAKQSQEKFRPSSESQAMTNEVNRIERED